MSKVEWSVATQERCKTKFYQDKQQHMNNQNDYLYLDLENLILVRLLLTMKFWYSTTEEKKKKKK